jgi:hypothetical protein
MDMAEVLRKLPPVGPDGFEGLNPPPHSASHGVLTLSRTFRRSEWTHMRSDRTGAVIAVEGKNMERQRSSLLDPLFDHTRQLPEHLIGFDGRSEVDLIQRHEELLFSPARSGNSAGIRIYRVLFSQHGHIEFDYHGSY